MDNATTLVDNLSVVPPKKVSVAVMSLALLVLFYVGRVHEAIPFIGSFPVAKVVFGFSLLLALTSSNKQKAVQAFWEATLVKKFIFLFCMAVVSIPGSIWQGASIELAFSHLLRILVFLYLVVTFVNTEEEARFLAWSLAATIFMVAIIGLLGNKLVAGRIMYGSTYDPNDMALIMVMSLPIIYFLSQGSSSFGRLILLGVAATSFLAIAHTGSRGGILALGVVLVGIILKRGIKRSILLIIFLFLFGGVVVARTPQEQIERYRTIGQEDYNTNAQGGRFNIWKRSIPLILANPILGSGGGAFIVAEAQTHEFGKWSTAHNSFIQIAVELGLIALGVFISLIYRVVRVARTGTVRWLGDAIEISMYAYCVGGFFLSWAYSYMFFFVVGFAAILEKLPRDNHMNIPSMQWQSRS